MARRPVPKSRRRYALQSPALEIARELKGIPAEPIRAKRRFPPNQSVQGMPRFYFNVYHKQPHVDAEGTELADHRAVWIEATKSCGEMMKDLDGQLEIGPEWRMEVLDQQRRGYSSSVSAPRWGRPSIQGHQSRTARPGGSFRRRKA